MRRRALLTCTGVTLTSVCAGCLNNASEPVDGGEKETPGVIEGLLLEEEPADTEVTPSDDDPLAEVEVIQELVRKATNPAERSTVQKDGEEYEMVALELQSPERSPERMREARDAIDTLRAETGDAYVSHESVVLELGYVVPA